MYQLHNVLNRTAVPRDPANYMKATEDFMTVVLFAHLVVPAKSMPISHNVSLLDIATNIIDKFVHLTLVRQTMLVRQTSKAVSLKVMMI